MIEQVKEIVRQAAGLMVTERFEVTSKEGAFNIVTSSDIAVQEFLCGELRKLLPGCGFVCEEEEHHDPDKEYVWIIDPIDGTANYSRGIDHCAISVALSHNGEVTLGVVYSPHRGEMYWACKGGGAFLSEQRSQALGEGAEMRERRLHVSEKTFAEGLFCTAMSLYRKDLAQTCSDIIMDAYYECNDVRRFGAASIELCFLAAGICDLYFEMRLQPWDYAAAMLVLTEAGGVISGLDGRLPRLDGPDIVCAANSPTNHARLLGIIRRHVQGRPY